MVFKNSSPQNSLEFSTTKRSALGVSVTGPRKRMPRVTVGVAR